MLLGVLDVLEELEVLDIGGIGVIGSVGDIGGIGGIGGMGGIGGVGAAVTWSSASFCSEGGRAPVASGGAGGCVGILSDSVQNVAPDVEQ